MGPPGPSSMTGTTTVDRVVGQTGVGTVVGTLQAVGAWARVVQRPVTTGWSGVPMSVCRGVPATTPTHDPGGPFYHSVVVIVPTVHVLRLPSRSPDPT